MSTAVAPVTSSVEVAAPIERVFDAFVNRMDAWWPREHVLHDSPYETAQIEPFVGGRWFTRHADGVETTVGKVEQWDPPRRVAVSWMINLEWACEPDESKASLVTATFSPVDGNRTLVELVHDRFEAHGDGHESMARSVAGEQGWPMILERFAASLIA